MNKIFFLLLTIVLSANKLAAQNYLGSSRSITWTDPNRGNRSIPVTFYYPALTTTANAAVYSDSFPIVVFGHGFQMQDAPYKPFTDSLVKRGYIVAFPLTETSLASVSHPDFAQDLIFVLNKLISEGKTNVASPFYNHIIAKGAIGGHSMGGGCTVLSASYSNPANCYFTFAAANTTPSNFSAAKAMTKPYLAMAGAYDCIAPFAANQLPMYDSSSSPCKHLVDIKDASHCNFGVSNTQCAFGEGFSGCASPPLSQANQIKISQSFLIPYLNYYLKGNCPAWTTFDSTYTNTPTSILTTKKTNCTQTVPAFAMITGDTFFCTGSSANLAAGQTGFNYKWSNGSSVQNVSVTAAGAYIVSVSNGICSLTSAPFNVSQKSKPNTPVAIAGSDTVCQNLAGQIYFITAVPTATSYTWTYPSGWNIANGTTSNPSFTSGSIGGAISVTANNICGASAPASKTIITKAAPPAPSLIAGADSVCANTSNLSYSVSPSSVASSYVWTYPVGWNIVNNNTASPTFTAGSTGGTVTIQLSNGCGSSSVISKTVKVQSTPANPSSVLGPDTACINGSNLSFSINPIANVNYNWSYPSGWTITNGNSNTPTFSTNGNGGTIAVTVSNFCGTSNQSSKQVLVVQGLSAPGTINGLDSTCANTSGFVLSIAPVSGASSYVWTYPAGWSGTNLTSTAPTFTVGSQGGTISVAAVSSCGASQTISKTIIAKAIPVLSGTISGDTIICKSEPMVTFTLSPTPADLIAWTVPNSWTANATNDANITITHNNVSGMLQVTTSNSCGMSNALSLTITVVDTPQPAITQTGNVLQSSISGVSYVWYRNGSVVPNATSQTLTATSTGSHVVEVTAANGCKGTSHPFDFTFVGINDFSKSIFKIYPNPASDFLIIEDAPLHERWTLVDAVGRNVLSGNISNSKTIIHMESLSKGVYGLILKDVSQKVVIE